LEIGGNEYKITNADAFHACIDTMQGLVRDIEN